MEKRGIISSNCGLPKPANPLVFFADTAFIMEKARVQAQVRISHLKKQGREDEETEELFKRIKELENFVDARLKRWTEEHPTSAWWQRISGVYLEPMGKFIGLVDSFGRYYAKGDLMIPPYVKREPVSDENGQEWIWVEGIERLTTPSKLFKYAGLDPEAKRLIGQLLSFNSQLRKVLFWIMTCFMMKKNRYYDEYVEYKDWKRQKYAEMGIKVLPTPSGRYCFQCEKDVKVKAGVYCPECGKKLSKKQETEGAVWEGHLDFMARRRAIKLFVSHWWAIYRQALGLPTRVPYPVGYKGHETIIDPWQMCDKPEPSVGREVESKE